jgi:predicted amidohydrolase YtcJ
VDKKFSLPSFHDHHFHLEAYSERERYSSLNELSETINLNQDGFSICKLEATIEKKDLDLVFQNEKLSNSSVILLKSDFHSLFLSPLGFEKVKELSKESSWEFESFENDWKLFKEKQAFDIIKLTKSKDPEYKKELFLKAQASLNQKGISGVDDLATSFEYASFLSEKVSKEELKINIRLFLNIEDQKNRDNFYDLKKQFEEKFTLESSRSPESYESPRSHKSHKSLKSDDRQKAPIISLCGYKIFLDGALSSHTAALESPYLDKKSSRGELIYSDEKLLSLIESVDYKNLQFSFHGIGPRAIKQAIWVSKELGLKKTRIEHVQIIDDDILDSLKGEDIILSIQPIHERDDIELYKKRLCSEDQAGSYSWAELYETGCEVILGSDGPIVDIDPWITLAWLSVFSKSPVDFKTAFRSYVCNDFLSSRENEQSAEKIISFFLILGGSPGENCGSLSFKWANK